MKEFRILLTKLRGVICKFWSHLGCSESHFPLQKIALREVCEEIQYIYKENQYVFKTAFNSHTSHVMYLNHSRS